MRLYFIVIILLILPIAIAQEEYSDLSSSYEWLANNSNVKTLTTRDSALAILALNNQGYDIADKLNEFKQTAKVGGCWPASSCTIIDTAFGLLVLGKTGRDINQTKTWLTNQEKAGGSAGGKWIIQIVTSATAGTCDVTSGNINKKISVSFNSAQNWIDINTISPMATAKTKNYYIDCSDLGDPTMHISLLYHISHPDFDETFLLQDEQVQQKDVTVDNACYPKTVGGSTCDLDSTLYATWVLSELGEEVHTIPYLEERLNEISQKQLNLALLYMITKSPAYATQLADRQTKSGSWIDEVYTTSFASFALLDGYMESYVNATVWLNLKRDKKDFSWNHKAVDTAAALIALHGTIESTSLASTTEENLLTEICDNGIDDNSDNLVDCDDYECSSDLACLCNDPSSECKYDSDCSIKGNDYTCDTLSCTCVQSYVCSLANGDACEGDSDCADGEYCDSSCTCQTQAVQEESEVCDDEKDNDNDDDVDCNDDDCEGTDECKKSSAWLWILLIIFLLGGGIFLFYYLQSKGINIKDFFKKSPKKKTFEEHVALKETRAKTTEPRTEKQEPITNPFMQKPKKKDTIDKELEKSLEEAKKLLGK